MEKVETNQFFRKAMSRASELLNNNPRLKNLVNKAGDKITDLNVGRLEKSGFVKRIKTFMRMVSAYAKREYRDIDLKNMVLIVAALVYFITPIDLIPDFIPITGFVDDFTVIIWVYNKIQGEIDKFMEWEDRYRSNE